MRLNASARRNKPKARLNAYEALLAEDRNVKLDQVQIHIPAGPRLGDVVVEAEDLRKAYGDRLLIDDLSFKLPRGGIVGVIGPNGAGKTTLLRMITGQEQPDDGSAPARRHGRARVRRPVARRARSRQDRLGGDLGRRRTRSRSATARSTAAPTSRASTSRAPTSRRRSAKLSGGERNRLHLAKLLRTRRQPAAARRADQRPRRRHAARARGGAAVVRRLRGRRLARSLVPRPDRHPRARVRGRLAGALVRGQLRGVRELPPRAARRRGRPAPPDHLQEARSARARARRLRRVPSKAVLITGARPASGTPPRSAWRRRLDRLRDRPPPGVDRRPRRSRVQDARARRDRRGLDERRRRAVTEAEGAVGVLVNNAGYSQSGAVETVPLDAGPPAVRDQRVRAGPDVPARAARDARPALGQDRQHRLDGRQAHVPRRRPLPRDQVRGRGAHRRAALRGPRLRRRRDPDRAGADRDELRRGRRGLGRQRRPIDGAYAEFNRHVAKSTDRGPTRARWPSSAAAPRRSRKRSPSAEGRAARRRAIRSPRAPA